MAPLNLLTNAPGLPTGLPTQPPALSSGEAEKASLKTLEERLRSGLGMARSCQRTCVIRDVLVDGDWPGFPTLPPLHHLGAAPPVHTVAPNLLQGGQQGLAWLLFQVGPRGSGLCRQGSPGLPGADGQELGPPLQSYPTPHHLLQVGKHHLLLMLSHNHVGERLLQADQEGGDPGLHQGAEATDSEVQTMAGHPPPFQQNGFCQPYSPTNSLMSLERYCLRGGVLGQLIFNKIFRIRMCCNGAVCNGVPCRDCIGREYRNMAGLVWKGWPEQIVWPAE